VFLKEREVLFNDAWRVAIDISQGTYEETASTIITDLLAVEKQKTELTFMSEFKQIETLVETLEAKLQTFHQVLPRLDKRRGLINFGGNVLKFLFGTAVVTDVHQLHESLDELQSRNSDLVYSLCDQLTYIKK
jgi:tetrahydromethanopterin S-methyltransferase subunit B